MYITNGGGTLSAPRIAIIFDDKERSETTGVYCLAALRTLVEAVHWRPLEIPQSAPPMDAYLVVDDGLEYELPSWMHPRVWWAIDTHLDFPRAHRRAHDAELVYAAQRDGAMRLCQVGITAQWLPLACDPVRHGRQDVPKEFDICFIGNLFSGPRTELVELLRRHFPRTLVDRRYFAEMARAYSAARIVFNRSIRDDVNMRVFEGLASGSMLLTNNLTNNGQAELFTDAIHLVNYSSADDLLEKATWYLRNDESRERIAATGRALALERHTYRHRMETIVRALLERSQSARVYIAPSCDASVTMNIVNGTTMTLENATNEYSQTSSYGYYEFPRPEVVAMVARHAQRVLDVGCGAGAVGGGTQSAPARRSMGY